MSNRGGRWWLAIVVIGCLAPVAFGDHDRGHHQRCEPYQWNCQQVPEGGSSTIYLVGAGLTCLGAMFLRSKVAKPTQP